MEKESKHMKKPGQSDTNKSGLVFVGPEEFIDTDGNIDDDDMDNTNENPYSNNKTLTHPSNFSGISAHFKNVMPGANTNKVPGSIVNHSMITY